MAENLRFTKDHEWLLREGKEITVGITEFAAKELGDVVFVELPEAGDQVDAGGEIAVIESVKAASDIVAPMAGVIIEANDEIVENPALVNEDPTGDGWFFKMSFEDEDEFDGFLTEEEYNQLID